MKTITIELTHEDYFNLQKALMVPHRFTGKIVFFEDSESSKLAASIYLARRALGMSTEPQFIYSDFDQDRDGPIQPSFI